MHLAYQWAARELAGIGIDIPKGRAAGLVAIREALELADNGLPDALRAPIEQVLKEIDELDEQIKNTQRVLQTLTAEDEVVRRMRTAPGVGLIVATATRAAINDIHRFRSGRFMAAWLGLTAKEHSSGEIRRMGGISKRGDVYLRTQLIHGTRALLRAANIAHQKGQALDRLRSWALTTQARIGTNKACVAVANKLARILWALWKFERDYTENWSCSKAQGSSSAA